MLYIYDCIRISIIIMSDDLLKIVIFIVTKRYTLDNSKVLQCHVYLMKCSYKGGQMIEL